MNKKIAIVDDHLLFAGSLKVLIESFSNFEVVHHAKNGDEIIEHIESDADNPDLILLDVNMPVRNGLETIKWLKKNRPGQKVLVLSMDDDESTIIKMINHGARGYILKDANPDDLHQAMTGVIEHGFHYTEKVTNSLLNALQQKEKVVDNRVHLKEREIEFLKLACTEKTYKQIAHDMYLSPRTIDGYREALFHKLNVKSRIGLVLFAIENNIVEI